MKQEGEGSEANIKILASDNNSYESRSENMTNEALIKNNHTKSLFSSFPREEEKEL
jgi:hypothetical protein